MIALPIIGGLWLVGAILGLLALADETAVHTKPVSLPRLLWPAWPVLFVTLPLFGFYKFAGGGR